MVESSRKARPWRQDVRSDTREQYAGPVITGPVFMEIIFYFPRPKGHFRTGKYAGELKPNAPRHVTSTACGDIDKLARCTLDGLSAKCGGNVIADDSLVVRLTCEKRYVSDGELAGASIALVQRYYDQ